MKNFLTSPSSQRSSTTPRSNQGSFTDKVMRRFRSSPTARCAESDTESLQLADDKSGVFDLSCEETPAGSPEQAQTMSPRIL
eukprot:CAMPEP_0177699836 /NCGR_PEP_ID=MMETSP0484_2-20121128/5787_1 /TAXON_ID=354590 /ORGANISM="Rhodomonas lens, Strain RHODO" /LENGTH=81 /DNA_ID=CAMNT_0019211023 /DNA_START=21 /DNA_END=266 /DNA_ORIENTATION=-